MKEETPSQYPKQVPMAVPIRVPSLCHIHTTFLSVFSAFLHCACDCGYSFLTITVPDVFIPCSRIATRVKTNIRGP